MKKDEFENVYCDSIDALDLAYKSGLHKKIKILTCSPWMNLNPKKNYINLDKRITGKKLSEIRKSVLPLTLNIYKRLSCSEFEKESILSAISGIELVKFVRKAACLKTEDLKKRSLIIKVKTSNNIVNEFSNTKWEILLDSKNISIKTFNITHPYQAMFDKSNYSYLDLLNIYSKFDLFIFLLKRLSFLLNYKKSKKVVLVFREDYLIREIIFYLFKQGVKPVFFSAKKIEKKKYSNSKFCLLKKKLEPLISSYIKNWVSKHLHKKVLDFYFLNLKEQLDLKESYSNFFDVYLKKFNQELLCISSFPAKPLTIALSEKLNKKKIKLVSTQHGVNREINYTCDEGMSTWENGVCDLLFVNNKESKIVSEKSPFSKGTCKVIGTAEQLSSKKRIDLFLGKKKIFYVSTRISAANRMMLGGHLADYQKALQELKLVTNVFKKVSKKIVFKTYPAIPLYVEKDPVFEEVNKSKNLDLLATSKDIQYYFKRMSLIITSRATSTLSWCILSNIPVVFINYIDQSMLKKEIITKLKKSLFFFNYSDRNFFSMLKRFLEKSSDEIYKEWKKKEVQRKIFIEQYISSSQKKKSGEVASNYIIKNELFKK